MVDWLFIGYLFVFGLTFGSFFNVVGLRVPAGESIVAPRSHCTTCDRDLSTRELIPVFSYLFQKGKCRGCGTKISPLYPFVELATGLAFSGAYVLLGWSYELIVLLLLISLLAIIFVSDIRYMLIPDKILLFFTPFFLLLRLTVAPLDPWWSSLVGAAVGFGLLLLIAVISRGGMGGGDIKLFAVLGLVLGWQDVLLAFFFSCLYGTIIAGIGMAAGKVKRKKPIPFGPFIVLGALTAYFYGNSLVQWYIGLFL
ncbi:peptidase A24A domain protein, aspartate peptidase [Alkalihalophilus pseudofirmus OF4]|uniref:Prepilin leader peptidase/N-methyltransferase n=1 Tax=Alkalihalophilus pseudofirmus (strain ATCC BAA-2126 / JCM 17055 / OF4) TaxID=398511 RepID=D3FWA6_ALKPO|nr:A24 family peptidase [Alkalihalophilus pseudofirmus]ADC48638.1 peptidase A24A domain protein, aspartate peptidase [Alkalihalophilus pseudofirmus OF4]